MLAILTKVRRNLMALVREGDASITDIAHLMHRDRAAVARDIKLLPTSALLSTRRVASPVFSRAHRF
jgi:predicted transcriptional regulator